MQLHDQTDEASIAIRGVSAHALTIGDREWRESLLIQPGFRVERWLPPPFATLGADDADRLLERQPQVVILGCGDRQRFAPAAFSARLLAAGVGLECMITGAAARTFNLLVGEGRNVLGAFLLSGPDGA